MPHLFGTACRCLSVQPFRLLPSRNVSRHISLMWPFPHRHQHARWPVNVTELLHRICWTPIRLPGHWAWLRPGYWCYRNLMDWLIETSWTIRKMLELHQSIECLSTCTSHSLPTTHQANYSTFLSSWLTGEQYYCWVLAPELDSTTHSITHPDAVIVIKWHFNTVMARYLPLGVFIPKVYCTNYKHASVNKYWVAKILSNRLGKFAERINYKIQ